MKSTAAAFCQWRDFSASRYKELAIVERPLLRSATDGRFLRPRMNRQKDNLHGRCPVSGRDERGLDTDYRGLRATRLFGLAWDSARVDTPPLSVAPLNRSNSVRLVLAENSTAEEQPARCALGFTSNLLLCTHLVIIFFIIKYAKDIFLISIIS